LLYELPASEGETFIDFFISPDGRYATISGDNHVQIWSSDPIGEPSGETMTSHHFEYDHCDGTCIFTAIALHDDHVAVATDTGILLVYDIETGELIHNHWEHQGFRITDIGLTSSGKGFASTDSNGTIAFAMPLSENLYYWDRWLLAFDTPFYDMAIDPTSRDIAVGGGNPLSDDPDTRIHIWDNTQLGTHSIPELFHIESSESPVLSLEFSPDGQMLVTSEGHAASDHTTLRFWNPETREMTATMTFTFDPENGLGFPESIQFSPDGSIMSVYMGSQLYVWETSDLPISGETLYDETNYRTVNMADNAVFSPDGRFIVANAGDVIQIWGIPLD
jgi:WD40 repeat protein